MPKQSHIEVEKRPTTGKGGRWVLRDAKTGKFVEVRSTAASKRSVSQAAAMNSDLLNRLTKR